MLDHAVDVLLLFALVATSTLAVVLPLRIGYSTLSGSMGCHKDVCVIAGGIHTVGVYSNLTFAFNTSDFTAIPTPSLPVATYDSFVSITTDLVRYVLAASSSSIAHGWCSNS